MNIIFAERAFTTIDRDGKRLGIPVHHDIIAVQLQSDI